MPIYTYRCNNCDHEFDTRQRFTDEPLTKCPNCDGDLRRVVGNVGVVFKGSGFYVTDNRGSKSTSTSTRSDKTSSSDDKDTSKNKTKEKKEPAKAKSK